MNLNLKKQLDYFLGNFLLFVLIFPTRLVGKITSKKNHFQNVQNITFIKMIGGGSLIVCLPTFYVLKKKYPQAKLNLICSISILPFAQSLKIFDNIYSINDKNLHSLIKSSFKTLWSIVDFKSITIDLELHSRLTTVFTTVSAAYTRVGLINQNSMWRKRLYTHAIFVNPSSGIYEAYDVIASLFNITKIDINQTKQFWAQNISNNNFIIQKKMPDTPYITIGSGCSDLSPERQLSTKHWYDLISKLMNLTKNQKIVFLGNKTDHALVEKIYIESTHKNNLLNLCGQTTLTESISLIASSQLFIGIDSALMHIARWCGIKTLGFWGPTDPSTLLRPLTLNELHRYLNLTCSPCVHLVEPAPCKRNNVCMNHDVVSNTLTDWLKTESTIMEQTDDKLKQTHSKSLVFLPDSKPTFYTIEVQY